MLDLAGAGRPGHDPVHLLLRSAGEIGFAWDSGKGGWLRPGLPPLRMLAGPFQHFKSAVFQPGEIVLLASSLLGRGFGEVLCSTTLGPRSFFSPPI